MQTLDQDQYAALREGARVIESDHFGEKVLQRPDGTYLKLFRRKRLLSSAAWYPYAQRFANNAGALAALAIPCPRVVAVYRVPNIARDAVHYRPLEGLTIRQLIARGAADRGLCRQLGDFVALLHQHGIYFRSLHLGNVVRTERDQSLGLIDIADLTIARKPLNRRLRARNMKHLMRSESDRAWLADDAMAAFCAGYSDRCGFSVPVPRFDPVSSPLSLNE